MGEIQWTAEQKKIIDQRGTNILVSAAAGSGKTAVLVERILQRILDERNPVNVDQFVIVTFTHAAAAQMKDKLREGLEKKLENNPENLHLQRQIPRLAAAHISTVHSFCGYVIQNYFHRIGLDPSYRQGTNSELGLIQKEVMDELLEEEYAEAGEDFTELASMNLFNHSDKLLEEMILSLYDKALSEPFPSDWLSRMTTFYDVETVEEWESSQVCEFILEELRQCAEGVVKETEELLHLCEEPDGPYVYVENVEEVKEIAESLAQITRYEDACEVLGKMSFSRMSAKKDDTIHPDKRAEVKDRRNACKDLLMDIRKDYFYQTAQEHLDELHRMGAPIRTLLRLTREFMERYTKEKRERNVVDFNDLEQLALSILLERDEEKKEYLPSPAARELAEHFEEIMIDEYQDSNRVQDTLLTSVSRQGMPGKNPNIFMVGDVKQSIYRFRNACPELFAEKLDTYSVEEDTDCRRIDLHQNFRSREVVLEGSNCVFERVMHRDIGGVEYDEKARLQVGRKFQETEENVSKLIDTYVILEKSDSEMEGRLAAVKIQEMVKGKNPLYIQDGDKLRPVTYKDIVILTRSTKTSGQTYFDMLAEAGVPVVMEHTQGFFDTREIQLMTEMLQVIDNPRGDIPLAGVLCGPMFNWTEEELAVVRSFGPGIDLYDSLLKYEGEPLREKIDEFLGVLNQLRKKTTYAAVQELIQDIYDITGIYDTVKMMRDGAQRSANMDSLMEQAREFDGSTYHGLHAFVQYIRRIQEQQEEMGEVNTVGEEEDVVRIMTIHKSKGLEFPVCLLLGMGRKLGGGRSSFLTIQPEVGIAAPIVDNKTRTKKDTLYQKVLKRQNDMADLGEELRVLYVAMTRAKEKLILIGCSKEIKAGSTDYLGRSRMGNYFDMVLPAALTEPRWFQVIPVEREEIMADVVSELAQEKVENTALNNFDTSVVYHEELHEYLKEFDREPEQEPEPLPVKVSVSDLKVKSMEEQDMEAFTILSHEENEDEMPVPGFMREKEDVGTEKGTAYGTIWHQVMSSIDFSATDTMEELRRSVELLVKAGKLRQEETGVLNYRRLHKFFQSPLGQAMKEADSRGKLHREQPFVMGKSADEIFPGRFQEKDTILVQGIIDGYYETEEGIVLMDYKTDSLKAGEEEVLVSRYRVQMDLYKKALENMLEKPVVKCVLYSFSLGKEVVIESFPEQ